MWGGGRGRKEVRGVGGGDRKGVEKTAGRMRNKSKKWKGNQKMVGRGQR